jgi:2-polyprenyl-3-methyl-5-hydroxy-6-metoxy-1,4-benzoquinol methylase
MSVTVLDGPDGIVRIEALPDGTRKISIDPNPGEFVPRRSWVTAYPLPLICEIHSAKGIWLCDEIMREEDPRYVESLLRREVLSYVAPSAFAGKRVLDFGCGSGASTIVLGRMLPRCEIVGIELEEKLLRIAQLRAQHFDLQGVRFLKSPSGDSLPAGLGAFDYVMFNAVFEHLLPTERKDLLPKVWAHLEPGGVLFLNQTPYRYSPMDVHTTGLPLINYLPDKLALLAARKFSKLVHPDEDWPTLLRRGIRGATVSEILEILRTCGTPVLLKPAKEVGDRIDLWLSSLSNRYAWLKKSIWASLKAIKGLTGVEITPTLNLAIRKED